MKYSFPRKSPCMDFSNVNFSCGTLSVDINEKEMRQEKKSCGLFFKCRGNSNIKNLFGSHESFGFGPIALIVETKS